MPSAIEWTEETWNPTTGCDRISPGCAKCYIERTVPFRVEGRRFDEHGKMGVRLHPDRLERPLHWRRPRLVFVSLSDLFHPAVSFEYIGRVFDVMMRAEQHTFQLLTKRPQRMKRFVDEWLGESWAQWLPNLWLGVSVENDRYAFRVEHLVHTPAAVRFVSYEPALGPVPSVDLSGIDWLIAGGESGPGARPCHPDWIRDIRDRCERADVAFFFKQWGEWEPLGPVYDQDDDYDEEADRARMDAVTIEVCEHKDVVELETDGTVVHGYQPGDHRTWLMARVGKKRAGRELDGRIHADMPSRRNTAVRVL